MSYRDLRPGKTKRKRESGDTSRSPEDGRVSACRGSATERLRACGRTQDCGSINAVEINRMNKNAQTARSCMLPTERRRSHSRGSLRIVSGLAENTNSIFCDGSSGPETVNGCPVLRTAGTPAERHMLRAAGSEGMRFCALLRSARQENSVFS